MSDEYPEHQNLKRISDQSQAICEFIDWLESGEAGKDGQAALFFHSKVQANLRHDGQFLDIQARFFEIDLKKLEEEKCQMLKECRKKT